VGCQDETVAWAAEAVAETAPVGGAICAVHLGHPTGGHALQPGAVLGCEDKGETAITLFGDRLVGFLGHVRRDAR